MANESHLSYGKNTISLKTAPLAGENLNVYLRPGDELKSSIDLSKAQYQIVGTDVVATLPNGGKITFVSLGMMVFEDNPPIIKLPNDDRLLVTDILNKVQNISQASKDSILTSGDVILQSDEKSDSAAASKKSDDPVVDYNAYYVDPQPNIKPQDEIGPKDNVGKYLTESPSFTSNETSNATSTQNYSSSETQSHSKDNIADVSAALSFDIGFYQIKSSDSTATIASVTTTTVLGGTGSALGNVSKLASAQFEPEIIDYRDNPYAQVITADDQTYITETFLTKLVRMSISQPIGFGITDVAITGLGSGFQILNSNGTSANATGGGWDLVPGTGFTSTSTDGGEIIEFYVKYEPANVTINLDYLMQVSLTSIFDMNNVPLLMQAGVVVPILDTLTSVKDVGVMIKTVESVSDYTYTGQYPSGYVLDTTPNENIIFTGKLNSTVYGGLSSDTISGNIGNDTLSGDKSNDVLSGGAGTNILDGGDGSADTVSYDFITKYSDDFLFANGSAIDPATTVPYANDSKGISVDLQAGIATGKTVYDATTDTLTGEETRTIVDMLSTIEYVVGSKYDDTIRGDAGNNKLMGGEGNDTLEGRGGKDWLDGGAGNDWLIGSTDDYMLDGGDNTDTADFSANSNGIQVALNNSANGTIVNINSTSSASTTTIIKNVENVAGTQYEDIITGDNANNLLIGGYDHLASSVTINDDTIIGGAGADTIIGDVMIDSIVTTGDIYAGSDVLKGGSENDILYGDSAPVTSTDVLTVAADQSVEYIIDTLIPNHTLATIHGGNDTLQGGAGDDYLNGGSGVDTVDYSSSTAKVTVNLDANSAAGEGTDQLFNIENIIGSISTLGDTLTGNSLINTIMGSGGGDTLSGLSGNDTLDGKLGNDWVDYGYAATGATVDLSAGIGSVNVSDTDTLISIENVMGSTHDDIITDKDGTLNILKGLNGNDTFFSHNDGDTLDGGSGIDTVDYLLYNGKINVTLGGSSNIDTLINIENILGAADKDTLVGDAGDNILDGRGDNDTLNGGAGNDTLYGGDGDDTLIGGIGTDRLDGGLGQNMADYSASGSINLNLSAGTASDGLGAIDTLTNIQIVKGSSLADIMKGSNLSDTLIGGSGNDTFFASGGSDIYYGNDSVGTLDSNTDRVDYSVAIAGVDNIFANLSTNSVSLRNSSNSELSVDTLNSIEEVYGTTGNDTMIGGSGSVNTLYGGMGDDTLTGNTDGDVLDGANGVNLADYSAVGDSLIADLSLSSKNIYRSISGTANAVNSDTLINIQNISSGSGNDTITGNIVDNVIKSGSGNDKLYGGDGADILYGEGGNDIFIGGAGNDILYGGDAFTDTSLNDTADYSTALFGIDANLTTGIVTGNPSTEGTDKLYGIENITGSSSADMIKGKVGVLNTLSGGGGNDTIYGGLDGDYIDGGSDINTVDYSSENTDISINLTASKANYTGSLVVDTLVSIQNAIAGSGNDVLIGGLGVNSLYGSNGNDTLTGNMDGDFLDGDNITNSGTADIADYSSNLVKVVDIFAQKIALSISDLSNTNKYDTFTNIEIIKTGIADDQFTLTGSSDSNHLSLDGGLGNNTVDYGGLSIGNIVVDLNSISGGYSTVLVNSGTGDDYIANINNITGSQNGDTITGDTTSNVLHGNSEGDKLDGGAGNDSVYGDAGNDTIIGTQDSAIDYYDGGLDSDTIDYSAVTTGLSLSNGITVMGGGVGTDTLANIEIFKSGSGADILSGGTAAMTIYGNNGADVITGGSGDDALYGGSSWSAAGITDNASNILDGGAGNDKIFAGSNGDILRGGAGNDTLYGGTGIDTAEYLVAINATLNTSLVGGDGLDIIDIETIEILKASGYNDMISGADTGILATIYAGAGNDIINGGAIAETIYGEAGNDTIRGGAGADIINGGDGDDLFYGNIDGDTITGGTLAQTNGDTLDFSDISIALTVDMVTGKVNTNASTFSEIENITGGSNNDLIYGDDNKNTLKGGAGNDTIFISNGTDAIDGGVGTDTVDFSSRTITSVNVNLATLQIIDNGNGETQTIQNIENLVGGSAADILYGDGLQNIIMGGLGADIIKGGDNDDILYGDDLTNSHANADGINTLYGEAGNDKLYGGGEADILDGGSGNDTLDGKEGSDIYFGGSGDDIIKDTGTGVGDSDTLSYSTSANSILASVSNSTISIKDGTDSTTPGTDTLSQGDHGIEKIIGSELGDKFFTTEAILGGYVDTFILDGAGGNDTIYGGSGVDTIFGGAGNDTIRGYAGSNILDGGADTDTLDYSFEAGSVTVNLGGIATIYGGVTATQAVHNGYTDTVTNFEVVKGGSGNDTIAGNAGADVIDGGAGNDWIVMTTGNDSINDTSGIDTIDYFYTSAVSVSLAGHVGTGGADTDDIRNIENVSGSMFADTIVGDDTTANTLIGRAGNDILYGGAGNDLIYGDDYTADLQGNGSEISNDFLFGGAGNDTIYGGQGNDRFNLDFGSSGYAADDGSNIFYGGAGDDIFGLQSGSDTVYGGTGIDQAYYGYGAAITANLAANASYATIIEGATTDIIYTDSTNGVEVLVGSNGSDIILGAFAGSSLATIYGGNGNDVITGNAALLVEEIHGGEQNDTLKGGGGADKLYGDGGTDLFYGNIDGDTIYGGETNETAGGDTVDFLDVGLANLDVDMTAGTVKISGSATILSTFYEIENIRGATGNDTIVGDAQNNYLYGMAGNDTLKGGAGSDYLDGGANTVGIGDWVDYTGDGVTDNINGVTVDLHIKTWQNISASRGSDYIINVENVRGTDKNDSITDDSGNVNNSLLGMAGDDTFTVLGGSNTIDGGTENTTGDTVSYFYTNGVTVTLDINGDGTAVVAGGGTDTLKDIENIVGSSSVIKDIITGNASNNTIWGNNGDDTIDGGGGADVLFGNSDNDLIYGGTGADTIDGGAGNDNLFGNSASAVDISGSKNTIYGGSGYDTIHGGLSNDILNGDSITVGRSGQGDWISYDLLTTGVDLDLTAMTAKGWNGTADIAGSNDAIGGFDNARGSAQADIIKGTTAVEIIYAGAGDDSIVGVGGADSLYGESGNDTFVFADVAQMVGTSKIDGGLDTDTVLLSTHISAETVTVANVTSIEQVQLAAGAFNYTINASSVSIVGTNSSDTIIGGIGYTNTIYAGGGDDIVTFAVGDLLGDVVDGGTHTAGDTLKLTANAAIVDNQFTNVNNFETLDLSTYTGTSITLGTNANHAGTGLHTVNMNQTVTAATAVTVDASGFGTGLTVNGSSGSDDVIVMLAQSITVNGGTGIADILEFKDAGTISSLSATISGIEKIQFSSLGINNITLDTSALIGSPTLIGGSNSDTFNYSISNLSSSDIIDGASGIDTLNFLDAGTILGSAMSGVSNVEVIRLKDLAGTPNNVNLGTVNATVYGGNQGDTYNYSLTNLSSADTIYAGTGTTDKLLILGAGSLTDSSYFTNLHSIEILDLNSFTGNYASIGYSSQSAGIVTVDASTRTSGINIDSSWYSAALSVTSGSGDDTLNGNSFYMAQHTLDGRAGNDTLKITYGTTIDDSMMAHKTNFEILDISAVSSGGSVTLGTNANIAGFTTVQDTSSNAKTIDIHGDLRTLAVNAGTGADTIIVNDAAQNAVINGGATGINTLSFYNSLTGGQAGSSGVIGNVAFSNIQKIQLANTGNDVTFDASAMGVSLMGGTGIDIFRYTAANFTTLDTIDGGTGNDTLLYTTNSNAITGADFTHLTSIETIQLADGGNTVSAYNYTYGTLVGGNGVDAISITTGTSGVKIDGAAGNDVFTFANATDMTNATTLIGNSGTDTVVVNGTTDITAASFAKLATVETVNTSALNANATLGTAAQIAGIVTVTDTGTFAKTINASAFGNNILAINANGVSDANDTVILDSAQTTVSVNLGSSTGDTLSLSGATTVADAFFSNKLGIETLTLTNGTMTNVTLGTNANTTGIKTVTDTGSNAKIIDVSGDAIGLTINAGTGVDTIIVDSTKTYTVDGGNAENNTLKLSNQLTASETGSATVIGNVNYSSVTTVQLADGGNTVAFDLYSGSGTNISLLGGSGNDVFKYTIAGMAGDSLLGGAGNDTLLFTNAGTIVQSSLSNVDTTTANKIEAIQFANGVNTITVDKDGILLQGGTNTDTFNYAVPDLSTSDTIAGGIGNDILKVTGGNFSDTVLTHMSSVEYIDITAIAAASTVTITAQSNTDSVTQINDTGSNGKTIDASTFGNASLAINAGSGSDSIILDGGQISVSVLAGTAGTDTLSLKGSANVTDGFFTNKTQIETLNLTALSGNLSMAASAVLSGITTLTDAGANGKSIDVSADNSITSVTLGSGNDLLNITKSQAIAVADSGGTDTLKITDQISSGGISATGLTNVEKIQLGDFTNSVTMDYNAKTILGGSGNDTFNYTGTGVAVGQFSTSDTINGGTGGTDVLAFTTAGTIDGTQLASLTNIDQIVLADGTNIVNSYSYTNGSLMGGTGDDTITVVAGTVGAKIYTSTGADTINVASVTDMNNATINGGADAVTDKIVITGTAGGTITASTVTNIDEIDLASGASPYTINTAISIVGSAGNDSIIGGASVNNTISAGLGNDTVEFDVARLNSSDIIYGGGQSTVDTFKLTGTANDVTASMLSNVREFETLNIDSTMTKNITLDSSDAGFTAITDSGTNSQTIDVSAYTGLSSFIMGSTGAGGDTLIATSTQAITVTGAAGSTDTIQLSNLITGGAGISLTTSNVERIKLADGTNNVTLDKDNVTLIGGIGNDTFNYVVGNLSSIDKIDGATGSNTLKVTGVGAITDAMFTNITNIQTLDLTGLNGAVTLSTNADNNTALEVLLGTTATTVDANGFVGNITLTGNATATDDTIKLNSSDFTSGDHIAADGGNDTLVLSGSTNFASTDFANVSGIETLDMSTFTGTTVTMFADASGKFNTYTSSNLGMTIDASAIAGGTFNLGSGNDNFTVGSGTSTVIANTGINTVTINSANLDSTDVITSGVGITDTLVVTGSTALSTSNFGTITGFEKLDLSGYSNNITVDSTLAAKFTTFTTRAGQTLTIDIAEISGKTIDGAGDVVITMGATSSQSLASITATGTQTLKFTADATYTGASIGSVDVIDVASSTTATLNASLISAKTLTFSGSGNMTINADNTAANNNFGSITDLILGVVLLNYSTAAALDLSSINIGTTLINTINSTSTQSVTLSGTQANNLTTFAGTGNYTVNIASGNLDLSGKTISGSGLITINDGTGAESITGSTANDVINVDSATSLTINGAGGAGDVLNVNYATSLNASNITNVETININANTTLTGVITAALIVVATGVTLTADASVLDGKTVSGLGTVNVTNLQNTLGASFTNITATTVNATWSSTVGTYIGNLTNVDTLTVSGGTMSIDDNTLGSIPVTGAGNITVLVDTSSSQDFNTLSLGGIETIRFTASSTFTGIFQNSTVSIDSGVTLSTDASYITGKTVSGLGTLSVTNLDATPTASFTNVNPTTLNVEWSGTGTGSYSGNLTNVDSLTISSGTMSVTDNILGSVLVGGAGNIIVLVDSSSSQDFTTLSLSGTETIEFTGNSTFTGNFQNSVVVVDSGVTLTADASIISGKTLSNSGILNVTNLETASAMDFTTITGSGTQNADWSGTTNFTGNIGSANLTVASGTMTVTTGTISGSGTVSVSSGAILSLDAAKATNETITNSGTVNVSNLDGTAGAILTGITGGTLNATSDGDVTFTGNIGNANLSVTGSSTMTLGGSAILSGTGSVTVDAGSTLALGAVSGLGSGTNTIAGTLSGEASVLSGATITGTGTVNATNLDATLAASFTNVNSTTLNVDWSGTGTYLGNLTNVNLLTISSGTMTINDSILALIAVSGAGSLTVNANDASMDLSNVNIGGTLTINDGVDSQSLTGSANADIFNIDNASVTSDAGGGNDTYNVSVATSITDTSGTDTLNIITNNINMSSNNITGIETLALGVTTGTTLNATEVSSFTAITGSGSFTVNNALISPIDLSSYSGNVTLNDANGQNVTLGNGNDVISATTGGTVNMGGGNDSLALDFSNLANITFDGAGGSDTVSFFGTNAATLNDLNAFTNIEKLDIHSLGLSAGGLAIDANSLYAFTGTNAGLSLELDAAATDLSNSKLSIDGLTSWTVDGGAVNTGSSFTLSAGDHHYSLTDTSLNTITDLYVHAL